MTDATPQAPAAEEVLPGNTPPQREPAEPAQTEESKPQFVTVEDLARREEELLRRFKQSDRDRNKRIEGELASIRQLLEKPGVKLDATQEAALREEIANRIDDEQLPQGQAETQQTAPQTDPVAQFVSDIFDAAGTKVTPKDPEWTEFQKVLDETWNDPKGIGKVTIAATRAAEAKAKRLAANQENASARVSGAGNASATGTPADAPANDLWRQAYRK